MKILDKTGVVTQEMDATHTWQIKIGGVVIFEWYYAEEVAHILQEYIGRKIRITISLVDNE